MLHTIGLLCASVIFGVMGSSLLTCGIGVINGTGTWCSGLIWFFGSIIGVIFALVIGLPLVLIFKKLRLIRWWQYSIAATLVAVPYWYEFAEPVASVRWQQSGFYDTLLYLGSGAFAGLLFWWFSIKMPNKPSNIALDPDASRPST